MRKLVLTSFTFTTRTKKVYTEQRLVVVNHNNGDSEESLTERANKQVIDWFPTEYPESSLLSVISHNAIGENLGQADFN